MPTEGYRGAENSVTLHLSMHIYSRAGTEGLMVSSLICDH